MYSATRIFSWSLCRTNLQPQRALFSPRCALSSAPVTCCLLWTCRTSPSTFALAPQSEQSILWHCKQRRFQSSPQSNTSPAMRTSAKFLPISTLMLSSLAPLLSWNVVKWSTSSSTSLLNATQTSGLQTSSFMRSTLPVLALSNSLRAEFCTPSNETQSTARSSSYSRTALHALLRRRKPLPSWWCKTRMAPCAYAWTIAEWKQPTISTAFLCRASTKRSTPSPDTACSCLSTSQWRTIKCQSRTPTSRKRRSLHTPASSKWLRCRSACAMRRLPTSDSSIVLRELITRICLAYLDDDSLLAPRRPTRAQPQGSFRASSSCWPQNQDLQVPALQRRSTVYWTRCQRRSCLVWLGETPRVVHLAGPPDSARRPIISRFYQLLLQVYSQFNAFDGAPVQPQSARKALTKCH